MSRALQFIMDRICEEDRGYETPCWIWQRVLTEKGYGRAHIPDFPRMMRVHRATYLLLKGPIPDGLEIDHLCRVTACCNPDHLEAVTCAENMRRRACVANGGRTSDFCIHGHDVRILGRNKSGSCRACIKARTRPSTPEQRAARAAYMREWDAKNRDRILPIRRARWAANADRLNAERNTKRAAARS